MATDDIPIIGTVTIKPDWPNVRRWVLTLYRTEPERARKIASHMGCEAPDFSDLEIASEPTVYVETDYPDHARWVIECESPAGDGWVFARETSTGQVLAFAPGQLRPLEGS